MDNTYFPDRTINPRIYAYVLPESVEHQGLIKIGYTTKTAKHRIREQLTVLGNPTYTILLDEPAIRADGTGFKDHDIHTYLKSAGFQNTAGEWFKCRVDDVKNAIVSIRNNTAYTPERTQDFSMRPEQQQAVDKTADYFHRVIADNQTPKFLWNAKMRFGKTFTAYKFAEKMGYKKILILTFKPAVQSAWQDDLLTHIDFENWQFITADTVESPDNQKPFVYFASLQDILGTNPITKGLKPKNEWVHAINWDLVIFDEYHYGAWRDNTQDLFEQSDTTAMEQRFDKKSAALQNAVTHDSIPITTNGFLYLSGTPFRAIATGEFVEDNMFNWTYTDEQQAKQKWDKHSPNPYAPLPQMVMLTYKMPESISHIALAGEYNEFDLNTFFKASYDKDKHIEQHAVFDKEKYVQKWLNFIRGTDMKSIISDLKHDKNKAILPFENMQVLQHMNHTIWYLPNVASCYAMKNMLLHPQNTFYHDYKIVVCAGASVGNGVDALPPVQRAMCESDKTITLTCGKLMTGVTVPPWSAIFMLRSLKSAESYFQSAFRVQSPHTVKNEDGKTEIMKQTCYVLDFAPNRALRLLSAYCDTLSGNDNKTKNTEQSVKDFISYLPILSYDGGVMQAIDEREILDIAVVGTSASLLAKRWESAVLVNVDNNTLDAVLQNDQAMQAIEKIEGFRNLKGDIESIISRTKEIDKIKKKQNPTQQDKKILNEAEKERKTKRQQIREKLLQFATRIPVFMYLSDYREYSLEDVIRKLEPKLFEKVTGLTITDFEKLVDLGLFNRSHMNNAVYAFKRYEESSLTIAGITSPSNLQ